jgi:hypothetical protein
MSRSLTLMGEDGLSVGGMAVADNGIRQGGEQLGADARPQSNDISVAFLEHECRMHESPNVINLTANT